MAKKVEKEADTDHGLTAEKLLREIAAVRKDVQSQVNKLRKMAYVIAGYPHERFLSSLEVGGLRHTAIPPDINGPIPEAEADVLRWAAAVETWARGLQHETEQVDRPSSKTMLEVTSRAGALLAFVERLVGAYEAFYGPRGSRDARRGAAARGAPPPPNQGPSAGRRGGAMELLSRTATVVYTARDLTTAARGQGDLLLPAMGKVELAWLSVTLALAALVYVLLHPVSLLFASPVPALYRPQYEVVFWSVFGAVAISVLTIAADMMSGTFVPARKFKYVYRIPLAPIVAYVLLLFLSLIGVAFTKGTSSESTFGLDPAQPNYPLLIYLSFLFGFFGKRSLDILERSWDALMARVGERLKAEGEEASRGAGDEAAGEEGPQEE